MTYGTEGTLSDRDIENLAKQLVKDIDEIIKCLETTHRNSSIARIIGYTLSGIGAAIGVLAAGVVIVPAGVVAAVGTGLSLTGAATSLGASVVEGIIERRKLQTIQKQTEMLKEHIPGNVLYSDMTDAWFMSDGMMRKAIDRGNDMLTVIREVYAMWAARLASKAASAEADRSVGTRLMILYSLFTEVKNLYQGQPTEVIKHLRVLKRELEHIARGCRYCHTRRLCGFVAD